MHFMGPSLKHRSLMGIHSKTSYVACSIKPNWTPNLQFSCSSQKTVSLIEMELAHISDEHTLCKWSKEMFTSSTFLLIEWQTSFCHTWLLVCDVVKFLKIEHIQIDITVCDDFMMDASTERNKETPLRVGQEEKSLKRNLPPGNGEVWG